MNSFPAFLDMQDRPALIIGGGEAAIAKARLARQAGASVTVIAREISAEHRAAFLDLGVRIILRAPVSNDFTGAVLVFIATEEDNDETIRELIAMAKTAGALVNVVDRPEFCDFTTPSIVDRGDVVIAISTNGAAPVYGRRLRAAIEAIVPQRAGALASFANRYRSAVKAKVAKEQRRDFWEKVFDGPIAAAILHGDERGAHEAMLEAINKPQPDRQTGVVHIVGAGPGDPELLTLKAFRLLQEADVILYDRLVSEEILSLARRDAERIYVGKAKADHAVPQEEIEERMIALAREGKHVVRLKGGDPFVFGRGGEELHALRNAHTPAHVVPGVTAATGCAASANLPLTHRDYAQAVTFVTGHAKGEADPDLDWAALAALKNTLVVYMGVTKAETIAAKLISSGRASSTPVAVIENGTRTNQKIIKGTLGDLGRLIVDGGIAGPAVLVIGEVAALADGKTLHELTGDVAPLERRVA